jgi:hypothetical protein
MSVFQQPLGEKLIMLFFFHKLSMSLATLCLLTGISTAAFFRHKRNWLKIHKSFNSAGFLALFAGVVFAFLFIYTSSGGHLDGIHQIVGLSAFIFTGVSALIGFYQFRAKNKLVILRASHRWLGRLSLLLIIAALILGLRLAEII